MIIGESLGIMFILCGCAAVYYLSEGLIFPKGMSGVCGGVWGDEGCQMAWLDFFFYNTLIHQIKHF